MAPEKMKISEDMLPPEQIEIKNVYDIEVGLTDKLILNVLPKDNYVVHYKNLKYYLSKGWRLTEVHSILKFKQKAWMKEYIEHNTQKRMEATTESLKNFFKLMTNAAYGKTTENKRNRMKLRIVASEKDFIKYASRPTFIGYKKMSKDYHVIHEKQQK